MSDRRRATHAVAVGGGHGLSRCLRALRSLVDEVTAVITAADDGGSSGRLRRDLDIVPPGDMRKALTSLTSNADLAELLEHRFANGELGGHSLGNLVIVAATELAGGDVVAGLARVARMLDVRGQVVPSTTEPVHLHARLDDDDGDAGAEVVGQVRVARSRRIREVWLRPAAPRATPEALAAIDDADLIVLGPGSLFTSVIPNLLVPGIAEALAGTTAPVVYVANLREQPGETEGVDLVDHLAALRSHAPDLPLRAVIAHEGGPVGGAGRALVVDRAALAAAADVEVLTADVYDGEDAHDPDKLAVLLARLLPSGAGDGRAAPP